MKSTHRRQTLIVFLFGLFAIVGGNANALDKPQGGDDPPPPCEVIATA